MFNYNQNLNNNLLRANGYGASSSAKANEAPAQESVDTSIYTEIQASGNAGNYKYDLSQYGGGSFTSKNNNGSVFINNQTGAIEARNLKGATYKGSSGKDVVSIFDSDFTTIDGQDGSDKIYLYNTEADVVQGGKGDDEIVADGASNIDKMYGGDNKSGNVLGNWFTGVFDLNTQDNDTLVAKGATKVDVMSGGKGDDKVYVDDYSQVRRAKSGFDETGTLASGNVSGWLGQVFTSNGDDQVYMGGYSELKQAKGFDAGGYTSPYGYQGYGYNSPYGYGSYGGYGNGYGTYGGYGGYGYTQAPVYPLGAIREAYMAPSWAAVYNYLGNTQDNANGNQ